MDMAQPMPAQAPQNAQMPPAMPMGQNAAMPIQQPPQVTHDVTILRTKKYAQAKAVAVPPEEFGIERNARTLKDCNYCFHKIPNHTEGRLIAQGYDKDQVEKIPTYSFQTNTEEMARDTVDEEFWAGGEVNRSSRPVEVTEHYIRMDYEGNGKPCLYKVTTAGGQGEILLKGGKPDIEQFDMIPFAAVTPVPITHRFFGRSIADLVMDIQRINTSLLRGMLDNAYMVSNPRMEVVESAAGPNTIDDLLTVRQNSIVRMKQPGGLQQLQTPPIGQYLLPVMGYMDSVREMRTGVTRQGQGVDADALQNQSATAVKQVFSASQARMKLIARIIAETGVRDMFSLLHATIRKHGQKAATVKLRNQWVEVDPRNWKTRNDMTINVGLGTGGKAEQFAQTMALGNFQKELLLGGKSNIVDDSKLFNTASAISKIMGHKNPDQFFNDPAAKNPDGSPKYPPAPPPVDPKVMAVQAKAQIDQQKAQSDKEHEAIQAQADIATQDRKTQAEMAQAQQDFQLKRELAIMQAQLDERKFIAEEARKEREHQQKMELAREQHHAAIQQGQLGMVATAQAHDAKIEQMNNKPAGGGE
jgi:hypothetical protein